MLIDEMLVSRRVAETLGQDVMKEIGASMVIRAHNVSDYFFLGTETEHWDDKDFPNVAPPCPNMWIEWRLPKSMRSEGKVVGIKHQGALFGVHLKSSETRSTEPPEPLERWPEGSKWFTYATLYVQKDGRKELFGGVGWVVGEDGELVRVGAGGFLYGGFDAGALTKTEIEEKTGFLTLSMHLPWLTLSFMHCRNVKLAKGPPHAPKLQKARARKNKPPLMRWHVLDIDPVKKIVASANAGNPTLTPKSLHICRGHFKHFTDRGLFGKYPGTYWWPMHKRGSRKSGVVLKDYRVTGTEKGLPEKGRE